ncbi:MAG: hypothetical protein EOP48_00190 [Sphingobacteriales bacterium]|nr:MAG: hypothetical protein EOP48_00190 [Sphingobacteriales bacterium]
MLLIVILCICLSPHKILAQCSTQGNQTGCLGCGGGGRPPKQSDPPTGSSTAITPTDPNAIVGLNGFESKQWLSIKDRLTYTVFYENDPKLASAPAQNVVVRLTLDSRIDKNSLKLADFGFGNYQFQVPSNSTYYNERLDLRDSLGIFLDVTAGIDVTKNQLFWFFKSIDPNTGKTPTDPFKGYLPINDTIKQEGVLGKGEGFVRFSILTSSQVATGDSVLAQAKIVFDSNEEIPTNTWMNTIDALPPISSINGYQLDSNAVKLRFSGQDDSGGTGLKTFAIYVSENNGVFTRFADKIEDTSYSYTGTPGSAYKFFTLATDNVGNEEPLKNSSNILVVIPNNLLVSSTNCPNSDINFAATVMNNSTYQWQVDSGFGYVSLPPSQLVEGATTSNLTLKQPPTSWYGYNFRCKISNANGVFYSTVKTLKFSMSWKGDTSLSWEVPTNWSCNTVPDEYTDVIINSVKPVKLNSEAAVRSIILYPGANVTITSNNQLQVKGKR